MNDRIPNNILRRYYDDPAFHALVHALELAGERFTLEDIRDAMIVMEERLRQKQTERNNYVPVKFPPL